MKKWFLGLIIGIFLLIVIGVGFNSLDITGSAVDVFGEGNVGPSLESQNCMKSCVYSGCELNEDECIQLNSNKCMQECEVEPEPQPADEPEACMQSCVKEGCSNYDLMCQNSNKPKCEDKCGMKGDAPDESEMSEEQRCITECVAKVDPNIICGSGTFEGEGETGNAVCQKCAAECVHLYSGPCLTDELWREKEDTCMAQGAHMEAAPVMGGSGEGYECTVDIECIDRSSEWGDDPGTGPGIGEEGFVNQEAVEGDGFDEQGSSENDEPSGFVSNIVDTIKNFFSNLFG
ncbi:MAG: hypothetical protein ABIH82_00920 [Candidatus Woesearchaeota archaeon]